METEEGEEVVGPAVKWHPHILQQVQNVDRQPTDHKYQEHQEQDKSSLPIAELYGLLLDTVSGDRHD